MPRDPLRVLVIEDDEDDYILTRDLLYDIGHLEVEIQWETTYEGGRAALEQGGHDVCLMDYRLGARDGMSLLRTIEIERLDTPVVFLTGQDSRDLDLKAMQAGAADYLVKGRVDPPLLERTIRYAMERQRLITEMHRRSLIDELTGLLNRRGFAEHAERQLRLALRRGRGTMLLFADIDNFKAINDQWGHGEGDRALREVAALIKGSFRESDIIARLGGDEFVVVLIDAVPSQAKVPQARLEQRLAERNASTDRPYRLSLTIGGAFFDPAAPAPLWDLVRMADRDMYRNKPEALATDRARPAPAE